MALLEKIRFFVFERKSLILSSWPGRYCYLLVNFFMYRWSILKGEYYRALASLLRYERDVVGLAGEEKVAPLYRKFICHFLAEQVVGPAGNRVLGSYITSPEAAAIRATFNEFGLEHMVRMKYPKSNDDPERQGDLIILKPCLGPTEKGILFIQYDEGVKRFAALFDIARLARDYRFVIEPSTCGYQNPMFFLCLGLPTEVVLEAQFEADFRYIAEVGHNFRPVRLGAGDWADPDKFSDSIAEEKEYDLVMIANWLKWKRHALLFSAIAQLRGDLNRVAVVGYPLDGRTVDEVRKECRKYGVEDLVEFHDRIPHSEVSAIIRKSKVGILLSREEGANRGIYECFFSGVPVILTESNRGVNREHLNQQTGMLASDKELQQIIRIMVRSYQTYRTRSWAESNTGYINSTKLLNNFFREIALSQGEQWTQDIFAKHNSPHARFAHLRDQLEADASVGHLKQFLREPLKNVATH